MTQISTDDNRIESSAANSNQLSKTIICVHLRHLRTDIFPLRKRRTDLP